MKKYILFLLSFFTLSLGAYASEQSGGLNVSPVFYDFGDIYQEDGKVSTEIVVENNSEESIEIFRLSTSCGCTTVEMDLSPLSPDEKRKMLITFDPRVHEDQFGEIIRVIYLQSSDPASPEIEIELAANVIGPNGENSQSGEEETPGQNNPPEKTKAVVFFNEACQDCGELVKDFYPDFFQEYDYELVKRDYINERENRKILNEYNEKWGVPFELQSHIEAFVGDNLLIGGHVPESIMRYLLENPDKYERLLVYQDEMHEEADSYTVWNFEGEIKTYPIDEPITTYLALNPRGLPGQNFFSSDNFVGMFSIISASAFFDGINPCAIAVLLFFIAFLFSIKRTKQSIWKMGIVYILAIFLAYFLIGIGIAQAIIISGAPHLMAYLGSILVIILGIFQLLGVLFPRFPIHLRIPINSKPVVEKWLHRATIPAAFIGGFIVGLCTFPCSGGIYVAIIGMLSTSQSYWQGMGWLVWYNFVFILPLVILLILAANPKSAEKLKQWERLQSIKAKVIIGVTMILLGLIIILFFT